MPRPYIPNDEWSRKAAAQGFRARSVFKLQELDERFSLMSHGMNVLDLGAAPGSWLQYASKTVGKTGIVIGVDLTPIKNVSPNVRTFEADVRDVQLIEKILESEEVKRIDVVLSDMAPSTSGIKDVDQWESVELARAAAAIAENFLRPGGAFVVKVFRGADFDELLRELKLRFGNVKTVSVQTSRDRSREVYLVMRQK